MIDFLGGGGKKIIKILQFAKDFAESHQNLGGGVKNSSDHVICKWRLI